jgi:hypothetical protein
MGSGIDGGRIDAALRRLVFAMGWGIAEVAGDTAAESAAVSVAEFADDSDSGAGPTRALE